MTWTQIGEGAFRTTVTIDTDADGLSNAVNLAGYVLTSIIMPGTWTTAALSAQISADGSTYGNFFDDNGEWSLAATTIVAASRALTLAPATAIRLTGSVKFRSGLTGAAVQQGADRVLTLIAVKLAT